MIIDSIETKQKILQAFLPIAAFDGWSKESLTKAMKDSGVNEELSTLIFENGLLDVAKFYIESYNTKASEQILKLDAFAMHKVRDKIRLALYVRFEVEKDNQLALQRLINFYLNPKNLVNFETGLRPALQALEVCYKIADFIWNEIGDTSTDFNYYTKRLTLGKIIFRSVVIFIKDESKDFSKTKGFIDSEIEKVMKFEKFKARAKTFSKHSREAAKTLFINEDGKMKSPKEIIKNLPFFRLMK